MMRGLWFAAGAAAGVYGMVRVRRLAEAFTIDGMRDRVGAAVVGARTFREEFTQGAVEAETRLRERYELAAARHRELNAGPIAGAAGTTATELERSREDGSSTQPETQEGTH